MKNYIVNEGKINLIKYSITYSYNKLNNYKEEKVSGTSYVINDENLENEKARLERLNAKYTVETLDTSAISKFDGVAVSSEQEAEELINPNIETIITKKNTELSQACEQTIFNGVDVTLSSGETKHFSLKIEDQMNLNGLVSQVSLGNINAEDGVPYHADGEICTMFSIADFTLIADTASAFKVAQTTYCNHLMSYVKSLTDTDKIKNVTYGQKLTGKFLESYNKIMETLTNE